MSEQREAGAGEREARFGRVVLQTHHSEVYSLDLYETHETYAPGLSCKGYYLPRKPWVMRTGVETQSSVLPESVPVAVELTIDDEAFDGIYEMLAAGTFSRAGSRWEDPWEPDVPYSGTFELAGTRQDMGGTVLSAEVSAPLRLPDRTVWTGRLVSKEGRVTGKLDFLLEQYGTIEPVLLLLLALYLLLFYDRNGSQQAEECYRQAVRHCRDEGNVKSINTTSGITGMTLRVDVGCQYECFERWSASDREGGDPPQGREDGP